MSNEVSPEKIQEWKKQYSRVQRLKISGIDYYYRPLELEEYMKIQELVSNELEEVSGELATVRIGVIHPELSEKPPAGVILKLSDEILKMSGFDIKDEPEEL